jgi:arsenate reductase
VTRRLKRVLFVCIGNSCRSQMAEAFARAYGSDVLIAASAGLYPATRVAPDTILSMHEKNLDLRDHFPKSIRQLGQRAVFDLVVNMSGYPLPDEMETPECLWDVPDPVSLSYDDHCAVRDEIERLVMQLVLDLRREQVPPQLDGQGPSRVAP